MLVGLLMLPWVLRLGTSVAIGCYSQTPHRVVLTALRFRLERRLVSGLRAHG
jgi:hypothetical protein